MYGGSQVAPQFDEDCFKDIDDEALHDIIYNLKYRCVIQILGLRFEFIKNIID